MKKTFGGRKDGMGFGGVILTFIISEFCLFPLFSFLFALLLSALVDPLKMLGVASVAVTVLCASIGSIITSRIAGKKTTAPIAVGAVITASFMLFAGLIISESGIGAILFLNLPLLIICATLTAYLAYGKRRHRRF